MSIAELIHWSSINDNISFSAFVFANGTPTFLWPFAFILGLKVTTAMRYSYCIAEPIVDSEHDISIRAYVRLMKKHNATKRSR